MAVAVAIVAAAVAIVAAVVTATGTATAGTATAGTAGTAGTATAGTAGTATATVHARLLWDQTIGTPLDLLHMHEPKLLHGMKNVELQD